LAADRNIDPSPGNAPVIHRRAVFTLEQARRTLHLAKGCLPREIRLGRLRVSKRAGKYLVTGDWLWEWIQSGELPRRQPQPNGQASPAKDGD
jgi:hypothetical protein